MGKEGESCALGRGLITSRLQTICWLSFMALRMMFDLSRLILTLLVLWDLWGKNRRKHLNVTKWWQFCSFLSPNVLDDYVSAEELDGGNSHASGLEAVTLRWTNSPCCPIRHTLGWQVGAADLTSTQLTACLWSFLVSVWLASQGNSFQSGKLFKGARSEFLNSGSTDILGQTILCYGVCGVTRN